MNLVNIQSNNELYNLWKISYNNYKLFDQEFLVSSSEEDSEISCKTYRKRLFGTFLTKEVETKEQQYKFLCESVEVSDTFEQQETLATVDVRTTFFQQLNENSKAYFLSRISLTPPEATVACKSFGMALASPENQEEYGSLRGSLYSTKIIAAIAAYRSETDENVWVSGVGSEINYQMAWAVGEPSNSESDEHCVIFKDEVLPRMNGVSCTSAFQFICEDNQSEVKIKKPFSANAVAKYMNQYFSTVDIADEDSWIYYVSKSSMKLSWFEAKLMCESMGMEMYAPESEIQSDVATDFLENSSNYDSFFIGLSSVGTDSNWYSINSGKVISKELADRYPTSTNVISQKCLLMIKDFNNITPQLVDCNERHNFICQRSTPLNVFRYQTSYSDDDVDFVSL